MEFKDYYAALGVSPAAPLEEIKRSYRKLARQYHPDVSKLPDAESRFKEINEAWQVLQDPAKRAHYDRLRQGPWEPNEGGVSHGPEGFYTGNGEYTVGDAQEVSEFFRTIFGGAGGPFQEDMRATRSRPFHAKGQDLHAKLSIPLTLAYRGGVHALQLQVPTIAADGRRTHTTKNLNVKIPAGVMQGSQIRLKAQGAPGMGGGGAGDLYIEIHLEPHPFFSAHHKDIHIKLPIAPWEAALGATLSVPTLGGAVSLKIPAGSQSEQKMRLKGRGLPGDPPGDQYVILQIHTPKADTDKARALYQEMAEAMPFNPRAALGV